MVMWRRSANLITPNRVRCVSEFCMFVLFVVLRPSQQLLAMRRRSVNLITTICIRFVSELCLFFFVFFFYFFARQTTTMAM